MHANLKKLKQAIRPTTAQKARASTGPLEAQADEPGFVFALESELRGEFLQTAHRLAREDANRETVAPNAADWRRLYTS